MSRKIKKFNFQKIDEIQEIIKHDEHWEKIRDEEIELKFSLKPKNIKQNAGFYCIDITFLFNIFRF